MVGVRGQVKAEYCVPMPRHTQTSLSIHLRLPGQLRCCVLNGRYLPGTPPAGGFWEFCEFWSLAETAAPKYRPGDILTLLAFGLVSLRLLDLVVPEGL